MTILNKIIAEKRKEVARMKAEAAGVGAMAGEGADAGVSAGAAGAGAGLVDLPTFRDLVLASETMSVIAEMKRASPSKGIINDTVDPVVQASVYAENGVNAISVLTDTPFFKGTMDDLRAVRAAVQLPVLNKDFIIDPIQIDRAERAGANIILLIAAALDDVEMRSLYEHAVDLGLEVLCEVHNEEEMERVLKLGAQLVGVNNRNLKTFEVDLATTERLAGMVTEPETILVSESGIETVADVEFVRDAGARAILVGETFMRADNLQETVRSFQVPLK